MPAVVAGAALSAAISGITAAAFSWAAVAMAFGQSLVLGALSYALSPKQKKPSFNDNNQSTTAIRQPDLTRQIVYGHTRVVRGYAHMESTGLNGTLHMILMLCEGPIRAINEIWVNDYCIPQDWIDSEGNITQGRYAGFMTIRKHLGGVSQLADSKAVSNMPNWTSDHRLQGIAYLYITMKKDQDVYPTGVPNMSAIVEGMSVYDPRIDSNRWTTNVPLYANDYLNNKVYGFGALDEDIDNVNTAAQANIADEIVDTVNQEFQVTNVSSATNIFKLKGDLLQLHYGDRVIVSSTGTLPDGLSEDTNYYVIPYQILTEPRIKLATSLDNSMAGAEIDIEDDGSGVMTITKTGEPRYHGGGVLDTEVNLSEHMNNLCSSMAGRAIAIGGYWTLLAGAWRTPSIALGIGDMRGNGMSFRSDLSMSECFNLVKGLFISQVNLYQNSDYPSAVYQEFINQDNGLEYVRELNLPVTNRPTTAQRIAKIELFRARQGIVFTSPFSTVAMQVQPGDNVELNIDRIGWESKPFEITDFSFQIQENAIVPVLTLRETAQEIFDWSQGEAISYDPAPNTNLPNPFLVYAVTGVKYNSRAVITVDDDQLFIVQLQWDEHPDAFVTQYGDFELQFKLSAVDDWLPSSFVDGQLTFADVTQASVGTSYDARIRARNNLGVRSGWSYIYGIIVGSSGGVTDSIDYGSVADTHTHDEDWGSVTDAPTTEEDWGFVV